MERKENTVCNSIIWYNCEGYFGHFMSFGRENVMPLIENIEYLWWMVDAFENSCLFYVRLKIYDKMHIKSKIHDCLRYCDGRPLVKPINFREVVMKGRHR